MASTAFAQGRATDQRETLRGMEGVGVVVETGAEGRRVGPSQEQLQADVEAQLKKAGIRPLEGTEPGAPFLRVTVVLSRQGDTAGIYAYSVDVELHQMVRLERQPSATTYAVTWSDRGVGLGGGAIGLGVVRRMVRDRVGRFVNDYLAVNTRR